MAQTKKKRSRKHRGTQAGTVETPSHRAGSRTKAAAKPSKGGTAKDRREDRLSKPPTWQGAATRAAIAAVVFAVVTIVLLKRAPAQGILLGVFAFVLYVPTGYYIDRFLYNRRQRQKQAAGRR
jgi:hypothetical protein